MKISLFHPLVEFSRQVWLEHLNSPESIFFKECITEREFKKIYPESKFRKDKTFKLIKKIKLIAMQCIRHESRFGVYISYKYLAEQLNSNKSEISRMLHKLEKKELIELIPVSIQRNGSPPRQKMLIFPHKKWITNNNTINKCIKALQLCLSKRQLGLCNTQLGLSPVDLSLYFESEVNSNSYKALLRSLLRYAFKDSFKDFKYLFHKYLMANSTNVAQDISFDFYLDSKGNKVQKFNRYCLLRKKEESIVNKKYIVDYSDYSLHPKKFDTRFEPQKNICKCLETLVNKNIEPLIKETKQIVNCWNNTRNSRFAKIRVNINSKTFNEILVLVTHKIKVENYSANEIQCGIKLFNKISEITGLLKFNKKLHLSSHYLWNTLQYSNKKWFNICQLPELEAISSACGTKPKYKKSFEERTIKLFSNTFYTDGPKERRKGKEEIKNNYEDLVTFSDRMCKYHQTTDTCGMSIDEYFESYFNFVAEITKKWKPPISYIIDKKRYSHFIRSMNGEPGYETFGNILDEEEFRKIK